MSQHDKPSKLRVLALEIENDLFNIGQKYVKHKTITAFFFGFFKPRLDNIISKEATEAEIKDIMWQCKKKLDKAFNDFNVVEELVNSKTDKKINEKLMRLPDFADLMELVE